MSNQVTYTQLIIDLSPEQQKLLSGGQNSDANSDGDFYKYKDKDKYKQKDKDITNFSTFEKDIYRKLEINLTIKYKSKLLQ